MAQKVRLGGELDPRTVEGIAADAKTIIDRKNGNKRQDDMNAELADAIAAKQDKLVSGTNIKTINSQSILGSGNIDIQGGGASQVQSDWNQADNTQPDYIKNKPNIPDVSGKADKSEMSVTPGTGANADKTTIQLKQGTSATVLTEHQDISGKQDVINDLSTIRSGAASGATAYQKPQTGIPSSDMSPAVQTSLGKAETAQQPANTLAGYGITDGYTKAEGAALKAEVDQRLDDQDDVIARLNGNDVVAVDSLDDVTTPDTQKIYRVPNHTEEIDVQGDNNALIGSDWYSYLALTLENNTEYVALDGCTFINLQTSTIIGTTVTTTIVSGEQYAIAKQVAGSTDVADLSYTKTNNDVEPTFYTDYMCVDDTTTPVTWKKIGIYTFPGIDDEPIEDSNKLVKSGGVWNAIPRNKNNIPSKLFVCDENGNVILDLSNGFVKTKNFDSTKIPEEIERLLQIIAENYEKIEEVENKINLKVSNEFGSIRLFVKDENGNVLLELYDGVIKTKSFNSNVLPTINTNNNNEFNICDCFGNVLLSVKNGNIISKYFNSNDVNTLALRVSEIERKSDGYDSLIARSTPAISWIDDDFDTSSSERREKLNILKAWAIENNIKPDIALIPDVTYTDVQKTDIESVYFSSDRLALAMEFEYSGLHMLTHPIHYGIYGDVIKDGHYIRKDLFLSRKALLDAGFPGCDIFVYAGSSAGVTDVVEAAKAYYDVAIMPGGNATNVNLPTKQNRFRLVRFSLDNISVTNTVSQIKQQIDDCIATGGWIIFITHVWLHTGDGTEPVDETSNSLSNVFNIIQYANKRVQIRPTQEVWKEKKILWEYYK